LTKPVQGVIIIPEIRHSGFRKENIMDMVKLGKKGQLSIPKSVLKRVGISGEAPLLVETTEDGAIILRQAAVYPLEIYSDARVAEFLDEDRISPNETKRVKTAIQKMKAA
jgi:AbrB family looped-hinge helix DNA binding protein